MRSPLGNFLNLLRLLPFVVIIATLCLWWQGTHGERCFTLIADSRFILAAARPDHLRLVYREADESGDFLVGHIGFAQWQPGPFISFCFSGPVRSGPTEYQRYMGDVAVASIDGPWWANAIGFRAGGGALAGTRNFTGAYLLTDIPYWLILLIFAPPALFYGWQVGMWLRRFNRPAGSCPQCAYDLRASVGRCPECGTSIDPNDQPPREKLTLTLVRLHLHLRQNLWPYAAVCGLGSFALLEWLVP